MENEKDTGGVARNRKSLWKVGLAVFMAALLFLSVFGLRSAYVSQQAILALQAELDKTSQDLSGLVSALDALHIEAATVSPAELRALQDRVDGLSQSSADMGERLSANLSELLTALAALREGGANAPDDLRALQAKLDGLARSSDELNEKYRNLSALTLALANYIGIEDADTPLGGLLALLAEEEGLEINPPKTASLDGTAQPGQTVTLTVSAPHTSDMYGYEFKLYYDAKDVSYAGALRSAIAGMPTIFAREFPGYVLVGATMTGDKKGYTSEAVVEVCRLSFTALEEFDLSGLSIGSVGVVSSSLGYSENVWGWTISATTTD